MTLRNKRGQLALLALVTLALTTVIGGAALFSVVASRNPGSEAAIDRAIENKASPEDMDQLQNFNKDFERSARILRAGGSLVGGGGPLPNPASSQEAAAKVASGIAHRAAQALIGQAASRAATKDQDIYDALEDFVEPEQSIPQTRVETKADPDYEDFDLGYSDSSYGGPPDVLPMPDNSQNTQPNYNYSNPYVPSYPTYNPAPFNFTRPSTGTFVPGIWPLPVYHPPSRTVHSAPNHNIANPTHRRPDYRHRPAVDPHNINLLQNIAPPANYSHKRF